jgi:hypothetical protein
VTVEPTVASLADGALQGFDQNGDVFEMHSPENQDDNKAWPEKRLDP